MALKPKQILATFFVVAAILLPSFLFIPASVNAETFDGANFDGEITAEVFDFSTIKIDVNGTLTTGGTNHQIDHTFYAVDVEPHEDPNNFKRNYGNDCIVEIEFDDGGLPSSFDWVGLGTITDAKITQLHVPDPAPGSSRCIDIAHDSVLTQDIFVDITNTSAGNTQFNWMNSTTIVQSTGAPDIDLEGWLELDDRDMLHNTYTVSGDDPNLFVQNDEDDDCKKTLEFNTVDTAPGVATFTSFVKDGELCVQEQSLQVSVGALDKMSQQGEGVPGTGTAQSEPTCASESGSPFAWILCEIIDHAQQFLEWVYTSLFDPLLNFDIGEQGRVNLESVWGGFRFIANLIFVIAFFVVIYAAASGNILSAYDVRKLLPRLFIVAILVQLSFFISMFALSFSNEIGAGVRSLILFPVDGLDTTSVSGFIGDADTGNDTDDAALNFLGDVTEFFVGAAVGLGILIVLVILFIYSIFGIILLMGVFIIRDVILLVLIVVSPVAFSLAVLPGTESFFRSWWKWYFGMLSVYPIMMAFLASGQLVAAIFEASGSFNPFVAFVVSTVALFLPYFAAPTVLRFAGQAVGALKGAFDVLNDARHKTFGKDGAIRSSEGWQNFKKGNVSPAVPGSKSLNKFGARFGTGFAGRYGFGQKGKAATARHLAESGIAEYKANPSSQQLAFNDNANAIMALSGGTKAGARAAMRDLALQEGEEGSAAYNKKMEDLEKDYKYADAVGFTRARAAAAMTSMSQYKSRAIQAGGIDIVDRGARRLSGGGDSGDNVGNDTLYSETLDATQFYSRGAGRADLGGTWHHLDPAKTGAVRDSEGHVRFDTAAARQANRDAAIRDGIGRTETTDLVRGHKAQLEQAAGTLSRGFNSSKREDKINNAVRMIELQNAKSYANADSQKVINEMLTGSNVGIDFKKGDVASQFASKIAGPNASKEQITAVYNELVTNARTFDRTNPNDPNMQGETPDNTGQDLG